MAARELIWVICFRQSFMIHQIRKMIGLVLAVVRGVTETQTISLAFGEKRIDVPKAPGLGLVLDQVHYDQYNERYGQDGIHDAISWDDLEPTIKEFRAQFIHPVIINTEINEGPMTKWLDTLLYHTYDDRVGPNMPVPSKDPSVDEVKLVESGDAEEKIEDHSIAAVTEQSPEDDIKIEHNENDTLLVETV